MIIIVDTQDHDKTRGKSIRNYMLEVVVRGEFGLRRLFPSARAREVLAYTYLRSWTFIGNM